MRCQTCSFPNLGNIWVLSRSVVDSPEPDEAEDKGDAPGDVENGLPADVVGDDAADGQRHHRAKGEPWQEIVKGLVQFIRNDL